MQEMNTASAEVLAFACWVKEHDRGQASEMLSHVELALDVLEERLVVVVPLVHERVPDVWSLKVSVEAMRDMAVSAGFTGALTFCQDTLEWAQEMVTLLEQECGIADHTVLPRVWLA